MKKTVFLLSLVCLFLFVGCSDEKPITLKANESYQLEFTSSNDKNWHSENKYIANVSEDGLVTANRIGETVIYGMGKKYKICVEPSVTDISEPPFMKFGASQEEVKRFMKNCKDSIYKNMEFLMDTGEHLVYCNTNPNIPIDEMYFQFPEEDRDKLNAVSLVARSVHPNSVSRLTSFVSERYYIFEVQPDGSFICGDKPTFEESTMLIGYSLIDEDTARVTFMNIDYITK